MGTMMKMEWATASLSSSSRKSPETPVRILLATDNYGMVPFLNINKIDPLLVAQ